MHVICVGDHETTTLRQRWASRCIDFTAVVQPMVALLGSYRKKLILRQVSEVKSYEELSPLVSIFAGGRFDDKYFAWG